MSKQQQSKEQKNYHEDFILNCLTQKLSFRKKIDLKHNQKNAFKNAQFVRYFAGYLKLKWPYIKLSYKQILCSYHLNKYKSQICTQSWKNDENCKNMINLISYLEQAQDCYYRNKYQKIFEVVHKRGLEIILLRIEMDQNLQGCFELLTCDKENTLEDAKQEQYLLQKNLRDLIQKNNNQNQQNSDSIEERQNCQKTNFQNMQQCELNVLNIDSQLNDQTIPKNQKILISKTLTNKQYDRKQPKYFIKQNNNQIISSDLNLDSIKIEYCDQYYQQQSIEERQNSQKTNYQNMQQCELNVINIDSQLYDLIIPKNKQILITKILSNKQYDFKQNNNQIYSSDLNFSSIKNSFEYCDQYCQEQVDINQDSIKNSNLNECTIFEIKLNQQTENNNFDIQKIENRQKVDQNNRHNIIYKTLIIFINYVYARNIYYNELYDLVYYMYQDDINKMTYLQQKLLKKLGLYLYKFLFEKKKLDIQFYLTYEKEVQILPLIVIKYLQYKQDQPIENIEVNIERLVQQYESLIPLDSRLTQDRILPYEEQYKYKSLQKHMSMKYENLQRSNTQKNYEFFNQIKFQETQIVVLKQMQLLLHQIQIDKNHSFKNQKFTFNDINKFFDCNTFSLKYIGTEEQFKTDIPTMSKVIHFKELVKKLSNQEFQKAFTQHDYNQVIIDTSKISILTIALQDQDETYFQIQNQTLFIILKKGIIKDFNSIAFSFFISYFSSLQTLMLNLKNDHNNCEFAQMLMKVMDNLNFKNIHLSMFDNKIGLEGCQKIANILQKNKSISQLSLKLVNNQISDEEINIIIEGLTNCQYLNSLNIDFSWNQIGNDGMKAILKVLKIFKRITHLYINLSSNKISDEGLEGKEKNEFKFCQYIVELSLNLKNNKISINGAQKIKSALEKNRKLAKFKLYLSGNYLDNQAIESLKEVLENFESCSEPYFDLFNIGNKGAQNIESEFEEANSNFDQLNQIEMFPIDFSQEKENIKSNQIINLNWDQIYSDTSQNIQEFLMKIKNCQLNIKISNFVNQNQCITSYQNIEDHLRQYTLSLVQVNKGENNQNIEKNYAFHLYLDIGILGYQEVSSIIANLKRHHRVYLYQNPLMKIFGIQIILMIIYIQILIFIIMKLKLFQILQGNS
ncbi:hypothetical protein ABPG73_023087 [Tetrahymena malaccensis]